MDNPGAQPLILTLRFDDASFLWLDEQRRQYFPTDRNWLSAHLTLFHHLTDLELVDVAMKEVCRENHQFMLTITKIVRLGFGVAYLLESPVLNKIHQHLQTAWYQHLTPQDRQTFRPHVTIQNKVAPREAEILFANLSKAFSTREVFALGFDLHEYLGGPWRKIKTYSFIHDGIAGA